MASTEGSTDSTPTVGNGTEETTTDFIYVSTTEACRKIWPGNDDSELCTMCGKGYMDTGSSCVDNNWIIGIATGAGGFLIMVFLTVIICLAVQKSRRGKQIQKLEEERSHNDSFTNTTIHSLKSKGTGDSQDMYVNTFPDAGSQAAATTAATRGGEEEEEADPKEEDADTDDKTGDKEDPEAVDEDEYDDTVITEHQGKKNKAFEADDNHGIDVEGFEPNLSKVDPKKDYFPWSKIKGQFMGNLQGTSSQTQKRETHQNHYSDEPRKPFVPGETDSGEYTPIAD